MAASRRHRSLSLFFGLAWGLACCTSVRGVEFAGGAGEPNDPYQIATAAQLLAIGSSPDSARKHYVLTNSIDLADTTLSHFVALSFFGTLDGKGFIIRNLCIEGNASQGMFGLIHDQSEVRNLGLVEVRVTCTGRAAALAFENQGRVVNCYSTGVIFSKSYAAGGLVGTNRGTVTECHSTATVTGSIYAGGLVGQNFGTVARCYATGEVIANDTVGGLVGSNPGGITESHFVGTATSLSFDAGGLVGNNGGRITSSYADATVVGQTRSIGGLVGTNSGGRIRDCYATGSVTGQASVGGLTGSNEGSIVSSYCEADVVSYGRRAGGLAGDSSGSIANCYATGNVEGEDQVGGLVGSNSGKISMSYSIATPVGYGWATGGLAGAGGAETAESSYFLDTTGPDNGIGSPLTSAQMKQQASFVGWDFWGTATDGVEDPWFMPPNAYPVLIWQTDITGLRAVPNVTGLSLDEAKAALAAAGFVAGSISYDFHKTIPGDHVIYATPYPLAAAGATINLVVSFGQTYLWTENPGEGTTANPYQIGTAGQLESLSDHPELWDKHFVLSADVDMTGRTYARALIAPDMDDTRGGGFQGTPFSGSFQGQGHSIRYLTIRSEDVAHDYAGLFGMIASGGRIDNLNVLDVDIAGGTGTSSYVGALAGYNYGTITNCSATGILHNGKGNGLVGFNSGSLVNCHADVTRI